MANFANIAKGVRPEDMDSPLELDPGPGMDMEEMGEMPDNEIVENDDGTVDITFGDEAGEIPALGFGDNIAEALDEETLEEISGDLTTAIKADDDGREEWKTAYEKGLKLLGLVQEERKEPFEGASGVVHPLLNEACLQFQSQAYKELMPPGGPVRTYAVGSSNPEKEQQGERVRQFMNYVITEVMDEYDPDFDQMLYYVGFGGSAFKKVYYDADLERAVSPFVLPQDLIVPYDARDLMTAERVTHVVKMSANTLRKLQVDGFYRDVDLDDPGQDAPDKVKQEQDKISGIRQQGDPDSYTLYECHCNLDIPGYGHKSGTGIKVPFVVTIEKQSGQILSIRRNYRESDPKCRKKQYFVHYKFLPGLGFYGLGLVHLLGNLAASATATLRQLIDSGTFANLPGGFKTKGIRVANEQEPLQPGEWRDVDAPNGDLSNALMPLPYKEPSATLFSLLGFIIESANKFVGTTDLGMGDSNQELPVGSVIALLERGSRIVSSVHKRLHYAQKQELKLLHDVIAEGMPPVYPYEIKGKPAEVKRADFDARVDIIPVSDPNIFSMTQRISLAQEQMKIALSSPQLHNMYEVNRRMYVALGVPDIDDVLNRPPDPTPEMVSAEHAKIINPNSTAPLKAFQDQDHDLHLQLHIAFYNNPLIAMNPAAQVALAQHLFEHVQMKAKAQVMQGMQMMAQQGDQNAMGAMQMAQQDPEWKDPRLQKLVQQAEAPILEQVMQQLQPPTPQGQDPLVAIKQKEVDLKEKELNFKLSQEIPTKLQLEEKKVETQKDIADERNQTNLQIADQRAAVALRKQEQDQMNANVDRHMEIAMSERDKQFQQQEKERDRQTSMLESERNREHQSEEKAQDRQTKVYDSERNREHSSQEADKNRKAAAKAKPKPSGSKK